MCMISANLQSKLYHKTISSPFSNCLKQLEVRCSPASTRMSPNVLRATGQSLNFVHTLTPSFRHAFYVLLHLGPQLLKAPFPHLSGIPQLLLFSIGQANSFFRISSAFTLTISSHVVARLLLWATQQFKRGTH